VGSSKADSECKQGTQWKVVRTKEYSMTQGHERVAQLQKNNIKPEGARKKFHQI
jgi:hypothetical protein